MKQWRNNKSVFKVNIIKYEKLYDFKSFSFSFPSKQIDGDSLLNAGPRTLVLRQDPEAKPIHALDQLIYELEKKKFKTIIRIDEEDEDTLMEAIQGSIIKNRV